MWLAALLLGCASLQSGPVEALGGTTMQLPAGEVRYVDQGQGSPIVMLHGFGAALESWGPAIDELSQQHRVLALDARGFGLSTHGEGDYSLDALAQDVVHAMDARGIDKATVVAHSWGGAVALAVALNHPERIERLVLVSSLAYEPQVPWAMRAARTKGLGEFIVGTFYTAQLDAHLEEAFYDPSQLTYADVEAIRTMADAPGSRAAALQISRGVRLEEWQHRYRDIDVPTLIVWGKQDRILNPWWAQRLSTDLAESRVETIDRCGHFPMLEQPEQFASLVEGFVP